MASLMRGIKAAIKARLVAVVAGLSAGTIHVRRRNFGGLNEAGFEALFCVASTGKLNGWEIEHESGTSTWLATNRAWDRRDTIVLQGYYGVDDANDSENAFSMLVEGVIEALNRDQALGGSVGVRTHGTAQVRQYGAAMFGGRLCHYAEIAITVAWANQVT